MLSNASAVLYSGGTTYDFPSVYKNEKRVSEMSNTGLKSQIQTFLFIQQDKSTINLNSLNIAVEKDYFMFPNDTKRHTVKTFTNGMYGSANMQHLEFTLE